MNKDINKNNKFNIYSTRLHNIVNKIWQSRIIPIAVMLYVFLDNFVPLLKLSAYNHSNADDYWMSASVHFTWVNTHNLFSTIAQAFSDAIWHRNNWDGCFLSMFLSGLCPVVFNESYYPFTFYLFAAILILGTVFFMFELCCRLLKMRVCDFLLLGLLTLLTVFGFNPSVKEALYWWCGGINYTFFFGVLLLAQALIIEYAVSKRRICLAFCCILSFCVGLGNLLSALVCPILLFLELLAVIYIDYIQSHKLKAAIKKSAGFILAFAFGMAGLIFNMSAPGNLVRGGNDLFSRSFTTTIIDTIKYSALLAKEYYKKPMLVILIAVIVIALSASGRIAQNALKHGFAFPFPIAVMLLSYLVYSAAFAPVVYAGSAFYGRCKEISYLFFIFFIVLNVIYLSGWVGAVMQHTAEHIAKWQNTAAGAATLIAVVLVLFAAQRWSYYFEGTVAKNEISSGAAANYHNMIMERFSMYYNDDIRDVEVTEIDWYPAQFYYDDDCLSDIAYYFGKDSVTLCQ